MLLAYYGDDFTGSTDALEWLARAGIRTRLFINPPNAQQVSEVDGLDAVGIAGCSRALGNEAMQRELQTAFSCMKGLNPRFVHYKVCSTFDSSPEVGSIGRAIEIGLKIFDNPFVPLVVGAPTLGRYCVFGNLFAKVGIGSQGSIYRLDQHPIASQHPVTPARDADLRDYLARQTHLPIALFDVLTLEKSAEQRCMFLQEMATAGKRIVLFDVLTDQHLASVGDMLIQVPQGDAPQFVVGSSAIEVALCSAWNSINFRKPPQFPQLEPVPGLLVLSGSCSSVTREQIDWAVQAGFAEIVLDTLAILSDSDQSISPAIGHATALAVGALREGRHAIVHTARGAGDHRVTHANTISARSTQLLGRALATILINVQREIRLTRVGLAGGDTSSYTIGHLGIESLEMLSPFVAGAPVCTIHSRSTLLNGMQINLKGGQVGSADYFVRLANGNRSALV